MTQAEEVGRTAEPLLDDDGGWRVEPSASLQSLYAWEGCPQVLRWSLSGAVTWQIRNEMTMDRILKSANLAPQFVAALLALGARVWNDESEFPLQEYLRQPGVVSGRLGLRIPAAEGSRYCGNDAVSRTPSDQPIVAVVACISLRKGTITQAGLGLTGVWSQPVAASSSVGLLLDGPFTEDVIAEVVAAVEREVTPNGNYLASEEYRRSMAGVLTRRALEACLKGVSG